MQSQNEKTDFIFYLTFDERLDEMFYALSILFKKHSIHLLPVRVEQLSTLAATANAKPMVVITSVRNSHQLVDFEKKIRQSIILLLKQKRFHFFQLSSFEKTKIITKHSRAQNSFHFKFPVDLDGFSQAVSRFYEIQLEQAQRWPGGNAPRLPKSVYHN